MESKQRTAASTPIKVLMFPWLAHGHISPFLELAKKLSTRNFHIYLCSSPVNLRCVETKLDQKKYSGKIELVELHIPALPGLPPSLHTTKNLPSHLMPTLKQALDLAEPNFANILDTHKPDLLIYDFLQPWAPELASSRGIPAVDFITSSGTMTAFMHHLYKDPLVEWEFEKSVFLRGYDKVDVSHLLNPCRENLPKDKTRCFDCLESSSGVVLIKSFKEVEGKYLDHLSKIAEKTIMPLPLVQDDDCGNDDHDQGGFIEFLNKKEKGSSVFVTFGTEYYLTENEMEEIALGLELSGVNFIWVLRFPAGADASVEKAMPPGFMERVGDRGMVLEGWAPQVKILKHASIGGFVSHCGWSSVMEAMKIGTPIVAIPMHIDQPVNARLVEEVGVGVEVVRDENGMLDRKSVAEVIKRVVGGDEGIKKKSREFQETLSMKGEEDIDAVAQELVTLYLKSKSQ